MKGKRASMVWGIALILVGLFFLAMNMDLIPQLSANLWAVMFALTGVLFFAGYFVSGVGNWPLLFPAVGSSAIAAVIWMAEAGVEGNLIGGLFLVLVSSPFWVAFLVNRQSNWWALIPAWAITAVGFLVILSGWIQDELFAALIMFAIALPFLVVYLVNRANWWALIPAYVLSAVGFVVLLVSQVSGEFLAALIMFVIALPFFVVYVVNRAHWWALIPAGIMTAIGAVLLITSAVGEAFIATLVMLAIAIPFFTVYLFDRANWWALIPAGILTSIGVAVLVTNLDMSDSAQERLIGGIILAGSGLTFGLLWSLRKHQETAWAKYPAALLGLAALLVLVFGLRVELVWSLGLIALGLWILYRSRQPAEKS